MGDMMMNLRKIKSLVYLYQVYKYLVFYPLLGIGTTIVFICIFTFLFIATERFVQIAGIIWARFNSFVTPMFIDIEGQENIDKNQSYIIVGNHQSQYDIFVIYGWLPVDFRWVMKSELRRIPILGYYCYRAGHIFINRSNREEAIKSINDARDNIKEGTSIMFFPEGTRSDTGELLEFKKGAFKFALSMQLPILPITISGTKNILPNDSVTLFPGSAKLVVHKPIDITGYKDEDIGKLIEATKKSIQSGLDKYPC